MNEFLKRLREKQAQLRKTISDIHDGAATQNRTELDEVETRAFDEATAELEKVNDRLEELEKQELRNAQLAGLSRQVDDQWAALGSPVNEPGLQIRVGEEPLLYRSDNMHEHDFVMDLFRSKILGDPSAAQRLEQHRAQMAATEHRATLTADLAGLVPPQFLVDMFAPVLHEARPFADTLNRNTLTAKGMTLHIPFGLVEPDVDDQDPEGEELANQDLENDDLLVPVRTIGGFIDLSRQSLERGELPTSTVYQMLFAKYGQRLDQRCIAGNGANTHKGLLTISGAGRTVTAASSDWEDVDAALVDAAVIVRRVFTGPATHVAMNAARWGWFWSQYDSTGRPLMARPGSAPQNVAGETRSMEDGILGPGLRVVVDDNISSDDVAIVYRAPNIFLWEENGGQPRTINAEQVLGHELKVRLIAYGYSAFTGELRPKSSVIVNLPAIDES